MIFDNPYYKATPSNNCPNLYCNDPLPGLADIDKEDIIIYEPWEADIPGPQMKDGTTVIEAINEKLKDIDKNRVTFITANLDCKEVPFANTVKYYPYHFLEIQRKLPSTSDATYYRNKHFCSFNGAIKYKRIMFVNFCKENSLLDKGYVSLVGNYDHGYNTQRYKYENLYIDKTAEELKQDDKSVPIKIYQDSYLNIINETHEENHVFFTEKTWKPILNCQMFLYYGVGDKSKYYKHLQDLGFELYTEFFNYENDTLDELKKFCDIKLEDIANRFPSIVYKLIRNKRHAMNIDINKVKEELGVKSI